MSCAKITELIEMPFGIWTAVGLRNRVLDGVQIPAREWAFLRGKRGRPRTCPDVSGN